MNRDRIDIALYTGSPTEWDEYVQAHPQSTLYHLYRWSNVMENALGHESHFLSARNGEKIVGVLPLILVKTQLFGNSLISMPFLNYGGVCADSDEIRRLMYEKAIEFAGTHAVRHLEIRNTVQPCGSYPVKTDKATYILNLLESEEETMKKLRKATRNRLRKMQEYGMKVEKGVGFLDSFYHGFAIAMKEHGTPVLPKQFFTEVVQQFGDMVRFYIASKNGENAGCKLTMSYKETIYQIWGGYPRKYRPMLGNYLLSWEAVCDAIDNGLKYSDFGRSNIGSGPADFKRHFGCEQYQLYWEYPYLPSGQLPSLNPQNKKYRIAIDLWKKMPLSLTKLVGPFLARQLP